MKLILNIYYTLLFCVIVLPHWSAYGQRSNYPESSQIKFAVFSSSGELIPCRIHLMDSSGNSYFARGLPKWADHFVCRGEATATVPEGRYSYVIERGPEFTRISGNVEVHGNQLISVERLLHSHTDMKAKGWYSGDMHVHRSVSDVRLLMEAENLDYAPVISWWNSPAKTIKPLDQIDIPFGENRLYTLGAGEDEREGGALLYIGLRQPLNLSVKSREFPSPMKFLNEARSINKDVWIDMEKPFWWDVPTWLASGEMNSIGLANNHMCHSQMLENEAWGFSRDILRLPNPKGNGYWSQEIYYHILNTGLRLPPSAGSASGVLPNPVGYNRVYVHLGDKKFTRQSWFSALKEGRCFVTNGPILNVTAQNLLPGSTFEINAGETKNIKLDIKISSNDPISHLEIIHNGKIVDTLDLHAQTDNYGSDSCVFNYSANPVVEFSGKGWFLVRAIADVDFTFRFASTSPWFLNDPTGRPYVSRKSLQFFVDWLGKRIARVKSNVSNPDELVEVLAPHNAALRFWKNRFRYVDNDELKTKSLKFDSSSRNEKIPGVTRVESQPLISAVSRLIEAMEYIGTPLPADVVSKLQLLNPGDDDKFVTQRIQELLDPLCLALVSVNDQGPPLTAKGKAKPELIEQGWRSFLIKVVNKPGRRGRLLIESPNAKPLPHSPSELVPSRWMQLDSYDGQPMNPNLSGLGLEYRIVKIYSSDSGDKAALLEFTVTDSDGQTGDLIREWRFNNDLDGWREMNDIEILSSKGSLHITSTGLDPFMGADVKNPSGPMVLRFWAKTDVDGVGQLFWWTDEIPKPTASRQVNFVLRPKKEHLYEVPFNVEGNLAGIRLDPLVKPGKMRIDWIDLYSERKSSNWANIDLDFQSLPSNKLFFEIQDQDGLPAFGKFEIRDSKGRVYPSQSKRLAPDFFFQPHIYRGDGESVTLPPEQYTIICSRGPETIPETKIVSMGNQDMTINYKVKRWVDPSSRGWWSGDHHIHAAGCLHYENPTQGVEPADMIRHTMGEDLKVGCCLTWGPCFDFQKKFFTGETDMESIYPYTLRYDIEVSGFGSQSSGHLNLLNLTHQIYPGGVSKNHWPTLGLNTLKWAKRQGGICGPAHSSIGLTTFVGRIPHTEDLDGENNLPNFKIPAFDGIGANEFIVDVTHKVMGPDNTYIPAVDFISTMNTERVAEWNIWYHVLNSGFRVAASGETDFPCMTGDRVGAGRVYAHVEGKLTFDKWVKSMANGRSYVSDGTLHLMDFYAVDMENGAKIQVGKDGSELALSKGNKVSFHVNTAALMPSAGNINIELVVNGYPVDVKSISPDGSSRDIQFDLNIQKSSWVALRSFPHAHTNPIYFIIDEKPVRGPVESALWCLAGVDQCWKSKKPTYKEKELSDAEFAYDHARKVFSEIIRTHPDNN